MHITYSGLRLAFFRFQVLCLRRRLASWAVIGCLAAGSAWSVGAAQRSADQRADALGTTQLWPVAVDDLAAGHRVEAADIAHQPIPLAFSPVGPPPTLLIGDVLIAPVGAGEILTPERFGARRGVAALLPPDHRGMAVPVSSSMLSVAVGDLVDIISPSGFAGVPGTTAATGAVVIERNDEAVTVAVRSGEAVAVAEAIERGAVLVLSG